MLEHVTAWVFFLAFATSAYGWGWFTLRGVAKDIEPGFAFTCAVGLAAMIPLGGLANLARVATPTTLYAMFGAGLVLAIPTFSATAKQWVRHWTGRARAQSEVADKRPFSIALPRALTVLVICVLVVFLAVSLLPTLGFNYHDDFRYYLARPARMLATGSLSSGPFDYLPMDSLGAQSFFHGFILLGFPLEYLDGFDAIMCFVLCLVLLIEAGRRYRVGWWYLLFAVLVLVFIHPNTVNISSLYSGSLMILTLFHALAVLSDRMARQEAVPWWWWLVLVALPLAALLALKNTYVLFAAPFLAVYFGTLVASRSSRRAAVVGMITIAIGALLLIVPWLALYATNLLAAFAPAGFPGEAATESLRAVPLGGGIATLFSGQSHYYGGTYSDYMFAVVLVAGAGLLGAYLLIRRGDTAPVAPLRPVAAAAVATVSFFFVVALIMGAKTGVRYSATVLIGVLPVTLALTARHVEGLGAVLFRDFSLLRRVNFAGLVFLTIQAFLIAGFSGLTALRISRAGADHASISFPIAPEYLDHHRRALGPAARADILRMQRTVPAGEPLLAFVTTPFHFDFARNPVSAVSEWGLIAPWSPVPFYQGAERLRESLLARHFRYVIWEYDHWGVVDPEVFDFYRTSPISPFRKFAMRNLDFLETLGGLARIADKVFDDGHRMVLDLGPDVSGAGGRPPLAGKSDVM